MTEGLFMNEARKLIVAMTEAAKKDENITSLYLFGSYARGEAKLTSDVDFAVVSENPRAVDRVALRLIESDFDFGCDIIYTTPEKLEKAYRELDVNYDIKEEGVLLWQR